MKVINKLLYVETHLSDSQQFRPNVANYTFKPFNRTFAHRNAPGTWGGVGFLIKNELLNYYSFKIIEKTYEGIFGIELCHNITEKKVLLISCYIAPESSPYGRDCDGFFAQLEQICYMYCNVYDVIIFCGDINARIGEKSDHEIDLDSELPERISIDPTENSHGKQFIDFLKNCKLCVLNGRFDRKKDNFTSIGRGKSVVDYFFCPHNMLQFCNDFEVSLRIRAIHGAKTTKNQTPLVRFA